MQDVPPELRVSLWNIIEPWIWTESYGGEYERRIQWVYNFPGIQWPTNEAPGSTYKFKATARLKAWMLEASPWYAVYDFVESLPRMVWFGLNSDADDLTEVRRRGGGVYQSGTQQIASYVKDLNLMLQREGAPYRHLNGYLVPLTNEQELQQVSLAIRQTPFQGARTHIADALAKLSQRPQPDYRNSIKESVSSLERLNVCYKKPQG